MIVGQKFHQHPEKGFTLFETVIVIGLVSILLFAFLNLFDGYHKIFSSQQGIVRIAGSASTLISEIQTSIMQANQVLASHTFSGTNYSSGLNTLVLSLPSIDSSGDVVPGTYDYIVFYLTGNQSYRLVAADPSSARLSGLKQLSDTVFSVGFTYNNADFSLVTKVDADIQTQTQAGRQTLNNHVRQEVYLRNIQ